MPVVVVLLDGEGIQSTARTDVDRWDDAFWARYVRRQPFTWQMFTTWWVARRWVVPRDIRKE